MKESLLSTAAAPPSVFLSDELLDKDTACRLIGGSKPIDWSTFYRGIRAGRYPRPVKIGRSASRWLRSELQAAIDRLIAQRDATPLDAAPNLPTSNSS
jgi:predicted DNA-binding transcriptional regulator AlpA